MVLHKGVQLGLDVFDNGLFLKVVLGGVNLVDALLHLVALLLELLDGFVVFLVGDLVKKCFEVEQRFLGPLLGVFFEPVGDLVILELVKNLISTNEGRYL